MAIIENYFPVNVRCVHDLAPQCAADNCNEFVCAEEMSNVKFKE